MSPIAGMIGISASAKKLLTLLLELLWCWHNDKVVLDRDHLTPGVKPNLGTEPIICAMNKHDMAVKIIPSEEGAYTVMSTAEQVWRKKYPSMEVATSEAVELQIMEPSDKRLADMSQPMPTYAQGFSSPAVEVDLDELIRRGFLLDA